MLMLRESQVQHTEVDSQKDNVAKRLPGIRYCDRLFTRVETYSKQRRAEAEKDCRKIFIDGKEEFMVLFVESEAQLSIWIENPEVTPVPSKIDRVASMPLKALAAKMHNVNGIKIKDRRHRLKVYPRCFPATAAVRWFMQQLKLSKTDALRLGQRLLDEKWIHPVLDAPHTANPQFQDGDLLYRFFGDEN